MHSSSQCQPPESGIGDVEGGDAGSEGGVKHRTVVTPRVKSRSPGGLPRETGALTPVLAAPYSREGTR